MLIFSYIPGCEKLEVNHIDSNRQNNCLTNLEWNTSSENTIHGINHGNKKVFGKDVKVRLTDEDLDLIFCLKGDNIPTHQIYEILRQKYPDLKYKHIKCIIAGASRKSYLKKNNLKYYPDHK